MIGFLTRKTLRTTVAFLLSMWTVPALSQDAATLTIHIAGVAPQGIVRLGLYDQAAYPDDKSEPVASADVQAVMGDTIVTLANITPGTYAIQVFQDLNSNGKMDTGFLGIPKEPYGFSRDAKPVLSKPDFNRVKFGVTAGANSQTLHLQNTATMVASN